MKPNREHIQLGDQFPIEGLPLGPEGAAFVVAFCNALSRLRFKGGKVSVDESGGICIEPVAGSGSGSGSSSGSGNMRYREELWNPGMEVLKYDIVRVRTGSSQGVWIAIQDHTATLQNKPVYPEPGGTIWHLLSFGPYAFDVCQGVKKTMYLNGLPPQ